MAVKMGLESMCQYLGVQYLTNCTTGSDKGDRTDCLILTSL